jgi:hypothetical protein
MNGFKFHFLQMCVDVLEKSRCSVQPFWLQYFQNQGMEAKFWIAVLSAELIASIVVF